MVFNATCRYEKDQVAEYLASVQVRLFHTCVTICEMAFDRFCNDCAQNEQFDCLDTRMQQYQFVPPFVLDQLQCLERCNTKPLEAEQLLEVQQTVSLHFNSCLPLGFGIVVHEAVIARYGVALELVDNLSVSEFDDIDVGLGRVGAIVQADVVRNKIISK